MGSVTTVGSQAYNLAGTLESRSNYLKTTVVASVVSEAPSLGKAISSALIHGPASKYRRFARWARTSGFNTTVGNITGSMFVKEALSPAAFAAIVPVGVNQENKLISFDTDIVNLIQLGRQYIYANLPTRRVDIFSITYQTATVTINLIASEVLTGNLIITFADLSVVVFTPPIDVILSYSTTYGYVGYSVRNVVAPTASVDPGWTVVNTLVELPSTTTYLGSLVITPEALNLTTTVDVLVTYSDGRPNETSSSSSIAATTFNHQNGTFTKTVYLSDPNSVGFIKRDLTLLIEYYYVIDPVVGVVVLVEDIGGGVTKTTTTTTTTDTVVLKYRHKETYIDLIGENWQLPQIAIYKFGSVPATDLLVNAGIEQVLGTYFPVIPLRRSNLFVNATNYPDQYAWNKKAVKKAFGKNVINRLIANLESNPQVEELDHAWVVFGTSISTQQVDGKEYIYQFFKTLVESTPNNTGLIRGAGDYATAWASYIASQTSALATHDEYSSSSIEPVVFAVPPEKQTYRFVTATGVGIQDWSYNVSVSASGGKRTLGTGYHVKSNSVVGTVWIYQDGLVDTSILVATETSFDGSPNTYAGNLTPEASATIKIGKQLTATTWEEYEFFELVHKNLVHNGLSVTTYASTALTAADEDSNFIIPLNEAIFKITPLVSRNQLSLEASFIVINHYTVTKLKWYQSGLFAIVLIIVIIIIAVYTGYVSSEGIGLLGTNGAVGAAITGAAAGTTTAIIAGAIANAIAAAIVASLITSLSTSIFGEKVGRIIGFIASVMVISWASSAQNLTAADMLHELTKAENLLKLSISGANAYSEYLSGKVDTIVGETRDMMNDHEARMKEIQKLTATYLGSTGIDPSVLAEATRYVPMETEQQFLYRTLMLGETIVDTTIGLVEDFPEPQLALPLA